MNMYELQDLILCEFTAQGKVLHVSTTGEGEVLIYTEQNGDYRNIIIDEDGDIEYLYVDNNNRADSWHEYFDAPTIGDITTLVHRA